MSAFTKKALILLGLLLLLVGILSLWLRDMGFAPDSSATHGGPGEPAPNPGGPLALKEKEAETKFWAGEILAEDYGRVFESLWDEVNGSKDKLSVLARFPVHEVTLPDWGPPQELGLGIQVVEGKAPGRSLSNEEWSAWLQHLASDGWIIDNLEFRHNRFDPAKNLEPAESHFYFAARLTRAAPLQRAMLEGDLIVDWGATATAGGPQSVRRIDASHLTLKTRAGEPLFTPILQDRIFPSGRSDFIDPLLLYDLDGDGLSEIILAARNLVYHRNESGGYEARPLCQHPLESITSAVIADFDGDGDADLLCASSKGLFLFKGGKKGTFEEPARLVWPARPPLKNALVMTCGDVDRDGDLDVFIGQYRVPTMAQILRPYYYDANDGWPSHLLLNDGHGNFTNATEEAGLGKKRWRRTYSASLVDLDGDGHLDLVVVSDFAGLDLYRNDGRGHFSEVTSQWIDEPHAFGMAHALADFNVDGRLDLVMIGMTSPTVDRLEHLHLYRPYSADDRLRRPTMAFGNRLFLAQPEAGFCLSGLSDSIARSGWSWGVSAFDFNNDGFPDVYIANGLETKQSVRDYEGEFWMHDIFIGDDIDDVTVTKYFMDKFSRTRGQGWSYGGYEKNRLFLNQHGNSFIDVGHLAGVALEQDSRNVVTDDLDGDGRVDLVVTTFEVWPERKQTLQIYRNAVRDAGHWIGFRFREQGPGKSPIGASVTIAYQGRSAVSHIVTGDSHRAQHSNTLHFGLGDADRVERAVIRWIDGSTVTLPEPAVNRYHQVSHP